MTDEEPGQHSRRIGRFAWLPTDVLPKVWCPCGGRMLPTGGEEYPHQFHCERCYANVDIHPPDQGWEPRRCGVLRNSVRCKAPVELGDMVCRTCLQALISEAHKQGMRRHMLELLGRAAVQEEATRQRQERERELEAKRAAQELVRQQNAGYVVYYARLGANHIKIGTTGDLRARMVALRVVNDSNLLAAEPGSYDLERQRHEQFKKWRYQRRKEDFGEAPDLLEHIRQVRADHGPPYDLAMRLAVSATPQ